jgi:senataxin
MEANFALHLYSSIRNYVHSAFKNGVEFPRVAIITPYAQQVTLLRRVFSERFKEQCEIMVEVNTVDGFQGRENDIVIFSTVRASGCKSIGFLSDVRRMNVALTRAKIFLFVVARCRTISMNPYWNELVEHAVESKSVVRVRPKENGCFPEFRVVKSISR